MRLSFPRITVTSLVKKKKNERAFSILRDYQDSTVFYTLLGALKTKHQKIIESGHSLVVKKRT